MPLRETLKAVQKMPHAKPGTPEFRRQAISRGGKSAYKIKMKRREGDLRVKTATKTVKEATDLKNKVLAADY
jgi:hypothetical protein